MSVDPTAIAAAIAGLLDSAGLDLDDLAGLLGSSSTTPTVSQAVADLLEVNDLSPTSLRTYSSYWRLFEEHYGERRMGELGPRDIQSVVNTARQRAVDSNARKNEKRQARGRQPRQTDGRGAAENCIRAIRALYRATYEELAAMKICLQRCAGHWPEGHRHHFDVSRQELGGVAAGLQVAGSVVNPLAQPLRVPPPGMVILLKVCRSCSRRSSRGSAHGAVVYVVERESGDLHRHAFGAGRCNWACLQRLKDVLKLRVPGRFRVSVARQQGEG
jgi:hypothetical protein